MGKGNINEHIRARGHQAVREELDQKMAEAEAKQARQNVQDPPPQHSAGVNGQEPAAGPLPQIVLPKLNRQESQFAAEMGKAIGPLDVLFRYQGEIGEIRDEPFSDELDKNKLAIGGLKFDVLTPNRARTWVEDCVTTGVNVQITDADGKPTGAFKFAPLTMKQVIANGLLVSRNS